MDLEKLKQDLVKARELAMAKVETEDGGTCNFDTCEIFFPNMRKATLSKVCNEIGLHCTKWGSGEFHIYGYECGQANRRTTMVETFVGYLQDLGYKAYVHYAMD